MNNRDLLNVDKNLLNTIAVWVRNGYEFKY